jgi:hypothetical protein
MPMPMASRPIQPYQNPGANAQSMMMQHQQVAPARVGPSSMNMPGMATGPSASSSHHGGVMPVADTAYLRSPGRYLRLL